MYLTPVLIEKLKQQVNDPVKRGGYRLLKDCVVKSDKATPKHILFKQMQADFPNLPKLIFYIIMDEMYPQAKAESGELGYLVTYISNPK